MEKGDILICKKDIKTGTGQVLFSKNQECEILWIKKDIIGLEFIINGNTYTEPGFPQSWIDENFDIKDSDE